MIDSIKLNEILDRTKANKKIIHPRANTRPDDWDLSWYVLSSRDEFVTLNLTMRWNLPSTNALGAFTKIKYKMFSRVTKLLNDSAGDSGLFFCDVPDSFLVDVDRGEAVAYISILAGSAASIREYFKTAEDTQP